MNTPPLEFTVRADDFCAHEAIRTPGAIQPHGALLALDPEGDFAVVAASENLNTFLSPAMIGNGVLGRSVEALLGAAFAADLRARMLEGGLRGEAPWQTTLMAGDSPLDVAAHAHDGLVIVEVERLAKAAETQALTAARDLQNIIADLRANAGDLIVLARVMARGIRLLTGYERVIVYRFDADWNGQAIAEDKVPSWQQSLDGLHFPASDIPAQARELYRRSPIRWVPDRDAHPVGIELPPSGAQGGLPDGKVDLSFARLRSLSPVHLQYHRNMGVNGSMSISVLHEDQLWGLIVCHHRGPHSPSAGRRAAAAALSEAFALRLGPARYSGEEQAKRADRDVMAKLLAQMADAEEVIPALVGHEVTIASMFEATGAALLYDGSVTLLGRTPSKEAMALLCSWLQEQEIEGRLFSSDSLSRQWSGWTDHAKVASGVLAVFLNAERTDMLVWFRPEEPQIVNWGGDPRKNADGDTVLPRQSFERWVEVRHGAALPWQSWQLELAEGLRHAITEVVIRSLRHIAELNEQLRQSQKMEAVGQLTGGIAHDFNNLLTGIIGSLELLATRVAQGRTGELDRYVGAAMTSANRAAALTHRLLAFSRRQTLDPKPLDVNRLIASLEELIRRTVGPSIHLETVMSGGLWRTLCDANQLENALLNLAINARDAMPNGGKLTLEATNIRLDDAYAARHHDVAAGQYVALSVTDTGTGMPPAVISRVFEPFYTTKPLGQGTGLGLSMVYGFATQSNGYARIYSEPGQGTTVRLYLPRYLGEADGDVPGRVADQRAALAGGAVLVVDDEPVVRMLVCEILGNLGYAVTEAENAQRALALLKGGTRLDLLLTDVGLPGGLNGRQLADAARATRPGMKVLFMTGYAENAVISNGTLEPDMQIITKPFALEVLAAKVRSML